MARARIGHGMTPLRALALLRNLDMLPEETRLVWAVRNTRDALAEFIKYSLVKSRKRRHRG